MNLSMLDWVRCHWTVQVHGIEGVRSISGQGPFARVGSIGSFEVLVDDSANMVYLQFVQGGAWVVPFSEGGPPPKLSFVSTGQRFRLTDKHTLVVNRSDSIEERVAVNQKPFGTDSLYLTNGLLKGYDIDRTLFVTIGFSLLGASSCCHLRLVHRTVNGIHCLLFRSPLGGSIRIVDLGLIPPTSVGDVTPLGEEIMEGSILRVGKLELCAKKESRATGSVVPPKIDIGEVSPHSVDRVFLEDVEESEASTDHRFSRKSNDEISKDLLELHQELLDKLSKLEIQLRSLQAEVVDQSCELKSVSRQFVELRESQQAQVLGSTSTDETQLSSIPLPVTKGSTGVVSIEDGARTGYNIDVKPLKKPLERELHKNPDQGRAPSQTRTDTSFAPHASREECFVLGRLVELRTEDESKNRARFLLLLFVAGFGIFLALATIWYSVPVGWRQRILQDLSGKSNFAEDYPD